MERIDYNINKRDTLLANPPAAGKIIVEDVIIDLDTQDIPQTQHCLAEDAPDTPSDFLA